MDENTEIAEILSGRVRQRLAFIEQRLYWEGHLTRTDIKRRFAVSLQQASADIAAYTETAPGNIDYDRRKKIYIPTPTFQPRYMQPDARKYLTELLLVADETLTREDSWIGTIPDHAAIVRVRRKLDADTLRPIVLAINRKEAIEIEYQSMASPLPSLRWIAPHALAFDGFRWHTRAWCYNRSRFRDFVFARIRSIGGTKNATMDSTLDRVWNTFVNVRLIPNKELLPGPRSAIELDYNMQDGFIDLRMRLRMTYYFERHLGLDIPDDKLPAARRQIVWENRAKIEALRREIDGDDQD